MMNLIQQHQTALCWSCYYGCTFDRILNYEVAITKLLVLQ